MDTRRCKKLGKYFRNRRCIGRKRFQGLRLSPLVCSVINGNDSNDSGGGSKLLSRHSASVVKGNGCHGGWKIARERTRFDDRTTVSDNTLHVNKQSFDRFRLFHFHFNRGCLTLGTSLERLLVVSTMNSCIKFIILMRT